MFYVMELKDLQHTNCDLFISGVAETFPPGHGAQFPLAVDQSDVDHALTLPASHQGLVQPRLVPGQALGQQVHLSPQPVLSVGGEPEAVQMLAQLSLLAGEVHTKQQSLVEDLARAD